MGMLQETEFSKINTNFVSILVKYEDNQNRMFEKANAIYEKLTKIKNDFAFLH